MCVRRVTLDDVLVHAAGRAGVDVRTGTNVTGLLREGDRVVGVETNHGPITASLVVGADGPRSRIAALVGSQEYAVAPPARMFAWGYFRGVPRTTHLELRRAEEYAYLAAPTDDDLYLVAVVPSMERKPEFAADREGAFAAGIAAWPELAASLDGAERDGPVRLMTSWHGYFREATGPGWVLVGDAGHFKDPTPGQGISDALRQSERLAAAIASVHRDSAALDESLKRWWKWRDRDAREMYWFGADLGTTGPIPPVRENILQRLGASERDTVRFLRVLNHEVEPGKVFTARQLMRATFELGRSGEVPKAELAREVGGLLRDTVTQARLTPPRGRGLRPTLRPGALRGFASARGEGSAARS
jgi:2-polyprenyl-6-methoxyphenol hydroxylase-like FAD-dependent oxidoreductase